MPFSVTRSVDKLHLSLTIDGTTFSLSVEDAKGIANGLAQKADDIEAEHPPVGVAVIALDADDGG